jgi:hypothetical protein
MKKLTIEQKLAQLDQLVKQLNLKTLIRYQLDTINPVTGKPYTYCWINGLKSGDKLSVNCDKKVLFTEICGKKYFVDNE